MRRRFLIPGSEQEEDQTVTEEDRPTVQQEHDVEEREKQAAVGLAAIADGDSRGGQTEQDQTDGNQH